MSTLDVERASKRFAEHGIGVWQQGLGWVTGAWELEAMFGRPTHGNMWVLDVEGHPVTLEPLASDPHLVRVCSDQSGMADRLMHEVLGCWDW